MGSMSLSSEGIALKVIMKLGMRGALTATIGAALTVLLGCAWGEQAPPTTQVVKSYQAVNSRFPLMWRTSVQNGAFWAVAFSPDSLRITTAGPAKDSWVLDARTGMRLLTLDGHEGSVEGVVFSSDGRHIATSSSSPIPGQTRVWDAATGKLLHVLTGAEPRFSEDGKRIYTTQSFIGSGLSHADAWDTLTGTREQIPADALPTCFEYPDEIGRARTPSGFRAVRLNKWNMKLRVVESGNPEVLCEIDHPPGSDGASIWALVSTVGHVLVSISSGTIRLWDTRSARLISEFAVDGDIVRAALSPDGSKLVSVYRGYGGSEVAEVKVWDLRAGKVVGKLLGHGGQINDLAWSPSGAYLVSVSMDKTAILWSME